MIRTVTIVAAIFLVIGTGIRIDESWAGDFRPAPTIPASAAREGEARIVLITASQACACMLRLCKSGESELRMALAAYPVAPRPEVIDNAKDPERVRDMAKQYGVYMLPAVLFLDGRGTLQKLYQGEVKREDLKLAIERFCVKGG